VESRVDGSGVGSVCPDVVSRINARSAMHNIRQVELSKRITPLLPLTTCRTSVRL
jgi:hypothetical protein